jgi:hypothetical protein
VTSSWNGEERRRSERIRTAGALPGQLALDLPSEVHTLSLGGMEADVPIPLAVGSEHEFSLALDGSELRLRGVVRHCRPAPSVEGGSYRLGVEFTGLDPERLALLNRFIGKRLSR